MQLKKSFLQNKALIWIFYAMNFRVQSETKMSVDGIRHSIPSVQIWSTFDIVREIN